MAIGRTESIMGAERTIDITNDELLTMQIRTS